MDPFCGYSSIRRVRRVVGFALVALAASIGSASATPSEPQASVAQLASTRPNVLVILTDDQAWSTFNRALMPTVFDRVVDRGALFTRAYVNTALCCPSRAQILTGLYGHSSGVDWNTAPLTHPTIVHALQDAGYRTMLAGKYLNSMPCDPRPEFDQWVCTGDEKAHYTLLDPLLNVNGTWTKFTGHTTDIQASFVKDFIASTPTDRPFFVLYSPTSPHLPANDGRCSSLSVPRLRDAAFNEETRTSGKPRYVRRPPLSTSEIAWADRQLQLMTRAVRCLDGSIATILNSLGERETDTLVFFLSDNGYLYGQHRRWEKDVPYEEAVRVPLAVRYPALLPTAAPFASAALVQNVDVPATIADVAGIPWRADGKSLVPLLRRQVTSLRDAVLIEHCMGRTYPCPGKDVGSPWGQLYVPSFSGVVTPAYKYVEYVTGEKELYVRADDPSELFNRAGSSGYGNVERALASRLAELRRSPVDTTIAAGPAGSQEASRVFRFTYFSPSRLSAHQCRIVTNGTAEPWRPCNGRSSVEGPLADGDHLFEVRGVDETGATDSSPASRSFSITTSGPKVTILSAPPLDSADRTAFFRFLSATPVAGFECRLGLWGSNGSWSPCTSSITYSSLADGLWNFQVRAVDFFGRRTKPPAQWLFRVSARGPVIVFDAAPNVATQSTSAHFVFHPDENVNGNVSCRLDGALPTDCSFGTFTTESLTTGKHTLAVTATDKAGITKTATFAWNVDRTAPVATITSKSGSLTTTDSATFEFAASEPMNQRFCRLDDAFYFSACTTPITYTGLADGYHTFTVMVADKAKNYSAWKSFTWSQDGGTTQD
jgi:arylsulfatase A-like enzyme